MKKIRALSLAAMAMTAVAWGTAHGQHVVGGMGEQVRLGAFANYDSRNKVLDDRRGFSATKRDKARARSADRHDVRPGSLRAPAGGLPGRHLP
jgi:hypothetical protein